VQYLLKIGKRIDHISFVSLDKDGLFGAGTTEESFEFAAMSDALSEPRLLKVEKGARLRL
jgi:hypothetical protein